MAPAGLANLQASLGLGSILPQLQGASAAIDLVLQARNSAAGAASLLALHQSDCGDTTSATNSNHALLKSDQKTVLPGDSSFYKALLDRKIREEETATALTAALRNAGAIPPVTLLGAPQKTTGEPLGQEASEAIPGSRARVQTIAEAAAANTRRLAHHGPRDEYISPASKRMKRS